MRSCSASMATSIDDGLVCSLEDGRWYVTFTSSGGDDRRGDAAATGSRRWGHEVHLVNLTAGWGAINVAGPRSRELLERLSDDPLDDDSFPYLRHREITVAGVACRAVRLGFVGELSYELHHPSAGASSSGTRCSTPEPIWASVPMASRRCGCCVSRRVT